MTVNVKIIHARDFIKTTATGILDFASSKQAIVDIASQIKQPGEYDVLVDNREAIAKLSITELFELGKALADCPALSRSRVGLVVPARAMKQADFFETVAVNRGVQVRTFTNFDQAIAWLVMPQELQQ